MDQHQKLRRAQQKVEAMTGFYIHFASFVIVMAMLFGLNAWTDPEWWVQWPFLGWGMGLAAHAWAVFGEPPAFVTNWQLRKIRTLRQRM